MMFYDERMTRDGATILLCVMCMRHEPDFEHETPAVTITGGEALCRSHAVGGSS